MQQNIRVNAFTTRSNRIVNTLCNKVKISKSFTLDQKPQNPTVFTALWDTGATNSVITQHIVDSCDLKPIRMVETHTAAGIYSVPVFPVSIVLPNNVCFNNINATLGQLSNDLDVLIGMDIICKGDFAITHKNNKTVFSFRMPSIECIDFVKQNN